ncbi:MAG: Na+/H+ antiporter NhaC family protein [Holophaga sp.]|nr:Na+/H+ antiporter NhaC family protein [Holophaga sp.]
MPMIAHVNIWWGLLGLAPLILYFILILSNVDLLPATLICVLIGAVLTHQTLLSLGEAVAHSLSSFLALVGLIIMLGRGLGEVLTETKVTHTLVHKIIYGIGIDTEKKAMTGIILSVLVVVGLLGTMAGGIAIIAPIIVPIAAAVGLSRSSVAIMFHTAGEEALILGPFTPPVITLLGLTHITYPGMLMRVAIPIAFISLTTSWFMLQRVQRATKDKPEYQYNSAMDAETFAPTARQKRTTLLFLILFIAVVAYGLLTKASTSYVIVIMLGLSVVIGLIGGLNLNQVFKFVIKGMAGNVWLFLLFLLLGPFLQFTEQAGGYAALSQLLQPLVNLGGKGMVVISAGILGAFGFSGATVAVLKMLNDLFHPMVVHHSISMFAWSVALVVATRVTDFTHPGANMFSSMGFADSKDLKSMFKNGIPVAVAQLIFLVIYAITFV